MLKGIDVSTWQGTIDYSKAKKDIAFIIPRTGFALTTDNTFRKNVQNAIANGVLVPAVYHFSYALSVLDAITEAKYAISEVVTAGLPKTTTIYYDFEYDSVNYAKKKGIKIGSKEINEFTIAFCDTCLEAGYKTGIYLNLDYYKNYYYKSTLSKYSVWLADWTGGPDYPCDIQQYTSTGAVQGVHGNVDLNYIFEDETPKTPHEIALEVIAGKWGNGPQRKINLENGGWNYDRIQQEVNNILNGNAATEDKNLHTGLVAPSTFDSRLIGAFKATEDVYLRQAPGKNKFAVCKVPKDVEVYCCGFGDVHDDSEWLYVHCTPFSDGVVYNGFICKDYLKRV